MIISERWVYTDAEGSGIGNARRVGGAFDFYSVYTYRTQHHETMNRVDEEKSKEKKEKKKKSRKVRGVCKECKIKSTIVFAFPLTKTMKNVYLYKFPDNVSNHISIDLICMLVWVRVSNKI